ncbi:MAG: Ig-like domain-containing protein, partial [Verrucomicrobiales bacterium]
VGEKVYRFSADGYLPAWRRVTLASGSVRIIPSVRLLKEEGRQFLIGSAGGVLSNAFSQVELTAPPAAFGSTATTRLTYVPAQSLPGFLPQGWSPLGSFWFDSTVQPATPLSLKLILEEGLRRGENGVLAYWNTNLAQWVAHRVVPGFGSNIIVTEIDKSGAWALIVPDVRPVAPPAATPGSPLLPSGAPLPDYAGISVAGAVNPSTSVASQNPALVTARAQLSISNIAGILPSGVLLRAGVSESYETRGGKRHILPRIETHFAGYQRPAPAGTNRLYAELFMQPSLLFDSDELVLGSIDLDVYLPGSFGGGIFPAEGASITNGTIILRAPGGAFASSQAVRLQSIEATNYFGLITESQQLAVAFDLVLGATSLQPLELQLSGLTANSKYILARVPIRQGVYGMEPVQRYFTDAAGRLASAEPASGARLSGLRRSGQYVLVKESIAQEVVAGVARDANGHPKKGLLIRRSPWVSLSGEGGQFQLLSPAGAAQLLAADLSNGDAVTTTVTVPVGGVNNVSLTTFSQGPFVSAISPASGSTNVPVVTSISLEFSKPLNAATTLGGAISLIDAGNSNIPVSITLNVKGDAITVLPINPLAHDTEYRVQLALTIADRAGMSLVGERQFTFRTMKQVFSQRTGAQLTSFEPTNGVAVLEGSQGLSEPGRPVILVNETTGRTFTILAQPDGSFRGEIEASIEDLLSITLVNGNGTRNSVPVSKQVFKDGSVALFSGGGIIEIPGETGPIQFIVEPGSISGKTKMKFESVPLAEVIQTIGGVQPENSGKVLGGVKIKPFEGSPLSQSIDVVFPTKLSDLGLPAGVNPTNCGFGLALSRVVDGMQVYELIDRMQWEDGKLATHSLPFLGLIGGGSEELLMLPILMSVAQVPLSVSGYAYVQKLDPNASNPEPPRLLIDGQTQKPLPTSDQQVLGGAVVVARSSSQPYNLRGRLRPGSVYAVSRPDGKYALLVPSIFDGNSPVASLGATHPRFPGIRGYSQPFPELNAQDRVIIGNSVTRFNVVFEIAPDALRSPPAINASHIPDLPPVLTNAVLSIVVTDNETPPSLSFSLETLVATSVPEISTNNIVISEPVVSNLGPLAKKYEYTITANQPLFATFSMVATDEDGHSVPSVYGIEFGGQLAGSQDNPPASDANDKRGPYVVSVLPTPGSAGLTPGQPIVIRFNEAINRSILTEERPIVITPRTAYYITLGETQTDLNIHLTEPQPGQTYNLTLGSPIMDISENILDQDSSSSGNQVYRLEISAAPSVAVELLDPDFSGDSGVGGFLKGSYAFLLERNYTKPGRLAVFDVSIPQNPRFVAKYDMAPYPREMISLGKYSFYTTNGMDGPITLQSFTNVVERELVAIVGGLAGQGQNTWLRILDVTDPLHPQFLAGVLLNIDGQGIPGRLRWTPPYLSYLETSLPDRINVINLQALIISESLVQNQLEYRKLPDEGIPGLDLNDDGDYTDAGEKPTFPARAGQDFGGKELALPIIDTTQPIIDFVLENKGDFIGAILGSGIVFDQDGLPTPEPALPSYRTLMSGGGNLPRELANLEFTEGRPRRMMSLFGHSVLVNNLPARRDLMLISMKDTATDRGEHTNWVAVLDVTERVNVKELTRIYLPRYGVDQDVNSLFQRDDGLIVVLQDTNACLIDPALLTLPLLPNGNHPALIGTVPGLGGMPRTGASSSYGVHLSPGLSTGASGTGVPTLSQTAPQLSFIRFADLPAFNPQELAGRTGTNVDQVFSKVERVNFLLPGKFRPLAEYPLPMITNLDPRIHYYVMVQSPGGAGPRIELGLEALDWAEKPIRKKGFLFAPTHAVGSETLRELGQTVTDDDAPVRTLAAFRVSNDPTSPYYNLYVSRPFVLVAEEMSKTDIASIKGALDREVIWSGAFIRAFIDYSQKDNQVVGAYSAKLDLAERVVQPGPQAVAASVDADTIPSPNPGPIVGEMLLPGALDAVSAHNSELVINATDFVLPGRRLSIEFTRTYRGQNLFDGPFGRGWDFNFNQRVKIAAGLTPFTERLTEEESEKADQGDLIFHNGAGQIVLFTDAGTNAPSIIANDPLIQQLGWLSKVKRFYLPPQGLFSPFFQFKDGRFARLEADGKQFWHNPNGRLEKIYDRFDKNSIEMVYNDRGELIKILDELGRALEIGYFRAPGDSRHFKQGVDEIVTRIQDLGKIARLKDYSNRDVLFEYSTDGLLKKRFSPNIETAAPGSFTGRQETQYDYSDGSNPSKSGKSLLAVRGEEVGGAPLLAVNELGRNGRDTVTQLNVGGRPLGVNQFFANTAKALAAGNGTSVMTNTDNSVGTMSFDKFGRITQSVLQDSRGRFETNRQEFYTNGLVKAIISPEGDRTEFFYDDNNPSLRSRGNLVRLRKVPGPRGGPVLEATTQYNPLYNLTEGEKTDFNGVATTIVLNGDKKATDRVSRGGEREIFTVNEYGQVESETSMDGITTTYQYDDQTGFIVSKTVGAAQTRYLYAPLNGATSDPGLRGKPSQVIDPNQVVTFFVHDELDQLVSERRVNWSRVQTFDGVGNVKTRTTTVEADVPVIESFEYLPMGFLREHRIRNVETEFDRQDLVTTYEPDSAYRIKRVVYPHGEEQKFVYDQFSRLQEVQTPGAYTNSFGYDRNGNLTEVKWGSAIERFVYDGHDRQIASIGANGAIQSMILDRNGNVRTNVVTDASGRKLAEWKMEYDELNRGRVMSQTRDSGESVMRYDYNSVERSVTFTDPLQQVSKTFMDEYGRAKQTVTPGSTITYTNDLKGNLLGLTTTEADQSFSEKYAYNELDQPVSITDNAGAVATFSPELDGRVITSTDRENNTTFNQYTLLSELAAVQYPNGVTRSNYFSPGRTITRIADNDGNATEWKIDQHNRVVTNTLANGEKTIFSEFNPWGHPARIVMPRGIVIQSHFDFEGKLTNRVVTGPHGTRRESFEFDGLRRASKIVDPSGEVTLAYDMAGYIKAVTNKFAFLSQPSPAAGFTSVLLQEADLANYRKKLTYPGGGVALEYNRDPEGRLISMIPEGLEPVISTNVYVGDSREGTQIFGQGKIRAEYAYDNLRRIIGKRYVRVADGSTLVDIRYLFDKNGAPLVKQYAHRGGRAEFYNHDGNYRLIRADIDVRPALADGENNREFPGFSVPAVAGGNWKPGAYARTASYLLSDAVQNFGVINPQSVAITPLATNFANLDPFHFAQSVDGFARSRDEVGSITRTLLAVKKPGSSQTSLIPATITYNELGMLSKVVRDDGVTIYNEYNHEGYRTRRAVTGPAALCEPSDVAFIYDGINLIEERDLANGAKLLARYYYGDTGDQLLAADILVDGQNLKRFYYLTDHLGSVFALADENGAVVERVSYDVWGYPTIQSADQARPVVSSVRREVDGLSITFSEPILPKAAANAPLNQLIGSLPALNGSFQVSADGQQVDGQWILDESNSSAGFGAIVRFVSNSSMSKPLTLTISNGMADEWGNDLSGVTLNLDGTKAAGTALFTGAAPSSTLSGTLSRSSVGSSFLFHGQVYDYDTGLLYCRARHYDPRTGAFLQRDPAGYRDSMNEYAGFANNPVLYRDATGRSVYESVTQFGRDLSGWGQEIQNSGGIINYAVGGMIGSVGSVLQLPATTAEAWDTLSEQGYGGTLDALNRLKAANTLTTSIHQWVRVGQKVYNAYSGMAQAAAGIRANAEVRKFQKQGFPPGHIGELMKQGMTSWEAEGYINWVKHISKKYGGADVDAQIRSFGNKADQRRGLREAGWRTKPEWAKNKTDANGALEIAVLEKDKNGGWDRRSVQFTGDFDFYYVKVNGKTLKNSQLMVEIPMLNRMIGKAYRRQ